jgi:hypothetical protein
MSNLFVYNRRNETHWISSDGAKLLPSEMEDSHLVNTIGYLERSAETFKKLHNLTILRKPEPNTLNAKFDNLKAIQAQIAMPASKWMKTDFRILTDLKTEYHERETKRMQIYATNLRHIESMHALVQHHIAGGSTEDEILRALSSVSDMVAATAAIKEEEQQQEGWTCDVYTMKAGEHFAVPYDMVTPYQRAAMKRFMLGTAYGLSGDWVE